MQNRFFLKNILPLVVVFISAAVFFISYNHYLLDKSLANLRISLKDVQSAQTTQELKNVKNILDDTFLAEITKDNFDFASVLKIEASSQVAGEVSEGGQLEDLKTLLQEVIETKTKQKPFLVSKINEALANIFSQKREENTAELKREIEKLKENFYKYRGQDLQNQYLQVVKAYLRMKNWDKALEYIEKIQKIKANNITAYKAKFYKGIVYKFQGKFEQASFIFENLKKDLSGNWSSFVTYQEADSLYQAGQKKKAIQIFENISKNEPYSGIGRVAQFRQKYIHSYDQEFANKEKAQQAAEKLKNINTLGLEELRTEEEREERREETEVDFFDQDVLETKDKGQSYLLEGFEFLRKAYFAANREEIIKWSVLALDKFEASTVKRSSQAYLHIGKALSLNFLDNNQQAQKEIKRAFNKSPINPIVLQYAAYIYYRMGLIDKSINAYQRVVLKNPESYLIRYNLATLYLIKGDLSKARSQLIRVIESRPSYAPAYNNLAFVLWDQNEYGEATKNLKIATSLDPDYVDAHYNLGIIYYNLGDYKNAVEQFKKVKELKGGYRQVFKFLQQANKMLRARQ